MSPSGDTSVRQIGPEASPSENARPREHGASLKPRVVALWPCRSLAQNRKELLSLHPKEQGSRSCYCLTRGAIGLDAVASPLPRFAVSDIDPVPLGQT